MRSTDVREGCHRPGNARGCTALVGCATPGTTPHVTNTVLTKTADLITARRVPTSVFSPEDSVVCYVYFQWDEVAVIASREAVTGMFSRAMN